MPKPFVVIVTPVGNERTVIEEFVRSLAQFVHSYKKPVYWVPVVDSYCTDGTAAWLEARQEKAHWIRLLDLGEGRGIAAAYLGGFQRAVALRAERVIEMDVGHPIGRLGPMLSLLDRVPVAWGTRQSPGGDSAGTPWYRRLLSWGGTWLGHRVLGLPMSDCTSGFEGFRGLVVERIVEHRFLSRGHMFQTEVKRLCANLGFGEVPFVYQGGASSLRWRAVFEAIWLLFCLRRVIPLEKSVGR